ncbi:MAG TPA: VWA domain-containing protein [Bryobacteraceae bacterium]|nr:VWA domain-containing protein [Bryobacteraceae bacterium]
MNFLNLSLGELLGVAGAISAGVVALYLLDRSKRRQVVATLRFWTAADSRTEMKHRKRIQQPWSLLLQLLSLLFLLIALAGPRLGTDDSGRDHVLILDTSAWMGARNGRTNLEDAARVAARAYVKALPSRDRVMVVRADALATPVTAFESDRQVLEDAIGRSQPGASALNLSQALEFAQRAQKLQAQHAGEIVYAGAGRVPEDEAALSAVPANLRVLQVEGTQENVGLRKVGLRRSSSAADTWDIFVSVKNYGLKPRDVGLELQFGGAPAGSRSFSLKPGEEQQATFAYKTHAAGYLEARLNSKDAFPQDDRAVVELPSEKPLRVVVYSNEPALLKPLIAVNSQVNATFESPAKYDPGVKADIVVLDRFAPAAKPQVSSIWIEPPAAGSPIAVKGTRNAVKLESWRTDTPLGAGLRTKDVQLGSAEVFTLAAGDIPVAESAEGPLIVARPGSPKIVALGFHPVKSSMKYELATPLLIANTLRWMAPDVFRSREVQAGTVGTVTVPVEKGTDPAAVKVVTEDSRPLPFTIEDNLLRFFSGAPATVRVLTGSRELVYSLTLPDVGDVVWKAPASVHKGIPRATGNLVSTTDIWPWFAVLGALGLLVDWMLFGRSRAFRLRAAKAAIGSIWRKAS